MTGQDEAVARPRPAQLPLAARGFAGRAAELATLASAPGGIWVISGTVPGMVSPSSSLVMDSRCAVL
jgi:hypothetical protein